MTLNPDKCIFSAEEVPWWGMMISRHGVSPDKNKVESLKHMSPPTSKDEVKSLFCMLQSNKNFIPRLASKTMHTLKTLISPRGLILFFGLGGRGLIRGGGLLEGGAYFLGAFRKKLCYIHKHFHIKYQHKMGLWF